MTTMVLIREATGMDDPAYIDMLVPVVGFAYGRPVEMGNPRTRKCVLAIIQDGPVLRPVPLSKVRASPPAETYDTDLSPEALAGLKRPDKA